VLLYTVIFICCGYEFSERDASFAVVLNKAPKISVEHMQSILFKLTAQWIK
jgi:hypothetical protein